MTDPVLGQSESLGDDSPTVIERSLSWAAAHRAWSALIVGALALVLAGGVTAWWRSQPPPPGPFDAVPLLVKSTGMGGVVRDQVVNTESGGITSAVVALELKASVTGEPTLLGTVHGITGVGVTTTDAQGIPVIIGGGSSVGVVHAAVSCATAFSDELSYRLVISLSDDVHTQTRDVPLGEVQPEWIALLRRVCQ